MILIFCFSLLVHLTLSSQDGSAKEDFDKKINFCLYLEFQKWLHVFTVSYGVITYKRSFAFQMEIKIICRRRFGSQTTQIICCGDFTLLFCIGRLRNVQSFKTHVPSFFSANQIFWFFHVLVAVVVFFRFLMYRKYKRILGVGTYLMCNSVFLINCLSLRRTFTKTFS